MNAILGKINYHLEADAHLHLPLNLSAQMSRRKVMAIVNACTRVSFEHSQGIFPSRNFCSLRFPRVLMWRLSKGQSVNRGVYLAAVICSNIAQERIEEREELQLYVHIQPMSKQYWRDLRTYRCRLHWKQSHALSWGRSKCLRYPEVLH